MKRLPALILSFIFAASLIAACSGGSHKPTPAATTTTSITIEVAHKKPKPAAKKHHAPVVDYAAVARLIMAMRWNALARYQAAVTAVWVQHHPHAPALIVTGSGINWDCVAIAETGGNWGMHGATYSTALGILNQAVRENTDPATAARILAGNGTRAEQIAVAESIVRKFGFRAWAPQTVARCS